MERKKKKRNTVHAICFIVFGIFLIITDFSDNCERYIIVTKSLTFANTNKSHLLQNEPPINFLVISH